MMKHVLFAILSLVLLASARVHASPDPASEPDAMDAQGRLASCKGLVDYLEHVPSSDNIDVRGQAYHFVFLLNAVRPASKSAMDARQLIRELQRHYLTSQERLSLAPFKLALHRNPASWEQPVDSTAHANALDALAHQSIDEGHSGGHDDGHAVLQAIAATSAAMRPSSIYCVVSDMDRANPPDDDPKYPLVENSPNFEATLAGTGFHEVKPCYEIEGSERNAVGDTLKTYALFIRVFLPLTPTALGPMAKPRAYSGKQPAGGQHTPSGAIDHRSSDGHSWIIAFVGGVLLLLVIAGVLLANALKTRGVFLEGTTPPYIPCKYGTTVYLATPDYKPAAGENVITLNEYDTERVMVGSKLASFSTSLLGEVTVAGYNQYLTLGNRPIPLTTSQKPIHLMDNSRITIGTFYARLHEKGGQ